jgi:hypothetical protein
MEIVSGRGLMTDLDWQRRLCDNVARVRQNIADACRRAGRAPHAVRLVGVTKYVSPAVLRGLLAAGLIDLGENHVQQLVTRAQECGPARLDWPDADSDANAAPPLPRWHMLGHLQRNKVKLLLPHARILHSLDSERLALTLQEQAELLDARVDVLIEVNVAGEATKTGVPPASVRPLLNAVARCPRLDLRGLMTMTPYDSDAEASRPYFRRLRELLDNLRARGDVRPDCVHLSMGMSQDYVVAVEEGATFVRVGAALFEGLPSTDPRAVSG